MIEKVLEAEENGEITPENESLTFQKLYEELSNLGVSEEVIGLARGKGSISKEKAENFLLLRAQGCKYEGKRIGEIIKISGQQSSAFFRAPKSEHKLRLSKAYKPRKEK